MSVDVQPIGEVNDKKKGCVHYEKISMILDIINKLLFLSFMIVLITSLVSFNILSNAGKTLSTVSTFFGETINNEVEYFNNIFKPVFQNINDSTVQITKGLDEINGKLIPMVESMVNNTNVGLTEMNKLIPIIDANVMKINNRLIPMIETLIYNTYTSVTKVNNGIDVINNKLIPMMEVMVNNTNAAIDTINNKLVPMFIQLINITSALDQRVIDFINESERKK